VIGTVPDLKTPIVPIRAFLITFRDHVAGLGERAFSGNPKAGIRIPFRVFDEATRGPDVEGVQRRLGPMRGGRTRLVGRMPGARRTAFIVPSSKIVTLARSFRSLAHACIKRR
jgi:hypothetical protein